jgi:hypothetical protein
MVLFSPSSKQPPQLANDGFLPYPFSSLFIIYPVIQRYIVLATDIPR